MAHLRSTEQHLAGSRPVRTADEAGWQDIRPKDGALDHDTDGAHPQPSPSSRAASMPHWVRKAAGALALMVAVFGVLALLAQSAYGVRVQPAFPCPPATPEAVRAATGCIAPDPLGYEE
jgi:hypothetical protein